MPEDDGHGARDNLDFQVHASKMQQQHNQYLKKKGLTMIGSDFVPARSNRSLANSQHNPISNRDHKRGITNMDSNQQINLNIGSTAIEGHVVPPLNMDIVQKKTERQRLIQQMLQPGDQYGFDQAHGDQQLRQSVPNMGGNIQQPSRHNKLHSEGVHHMGGTTVNFSHVNEVQQLETNDLYGFNRASQAENTPVGRNNKMVIEPQPAKSQ